MTKYDEIRMRCAYGYVTDDQLAAYVTKSVLTQAQADAIKQDRENPVLAAVLDENKLLKAQLQALTERSEFLDDCIAEMAAKVYNT